jgi:excisionase family DNA binding protein
MNANHNQPAHTQPNVPTKDPGFRVEGFPVLLGISEAAKFLGLTCWQIRGLIARKALPVVEVGRAFKLRRATLEKWAAGEEGFVTRRR